MEEEQKHDDVPSEASVEVETSTQSHDVPKKISLWRRVSRHHVLLAVSAVALIVASSGATYFLVKKENSANGNSEKTSTDTTAGKDKASADEKPIDTTKKELTFTWQTPSPVSPLPIYENLEGYYKNEYTSDGDVSSTIAQHKYFLVGVASDGAKAYITTAPQTMGPGAEPILFLIEKDGKYTVYQQHSEGWFYTNTDGQAATYQGPKLASNTSINSSEIISEIETKKEISYKNQTLSTAGGFNSGMSFLETKEPKPYTGSTATYTKVADLNEGTLYEFVQSSDPSYKISNFYLVYKNHTTGSFIVSGELSKAKIDPITWKDGSKNNDDYASVGRGCGITGANEVALGVTKDMLEEIGKSDKGQSVYGFKSTSALLVNKHYGEYNIENQTGFYTKEDQNLTLQQFIDRKPIYLVDDNLGRWLVFSNLRYVPQGGCAKPVVYLYPETTKQVDVKVVADVTASDPFYDSAQGWKNVIATPAGKLLYRGKVYSSLFWEGYAHGVYPEITRGSVVARDQVVDTWKDQLHKLGLNDKEIGDFVTYWEPRIPETAFVRISWLGTAEMQRLAPLQVTGGVNTFIRVFLDMEGYNDYRQIEPQQLFGISRHGFTVVEWGGLVRDGSIPKIQ